MKNGVILFILLLMNTLIVFSQEDKNNLLQRNDIHQMLELDTIPQFRGGYDSLLIYIDRHLRYPSIYADASIQGRIVCSFIINEHGKVIDAKIIRGIDQPLDEAVKELFYSMPLWIPGKKGGKTVKVEMFLPIFCYTK